MKLKKLDMRGFSHEVLMMAFVAIFAIVGVGFLVASHAQTPPCVKRTFGQGNASHCVKDIQTVTLHTRGVPKVKVDGKYGPSTKAAIIKYQQVYRLPADGIVGRRTWTSICRSLGAQARIGLDKPSSIAYYDAGCNSILPGVAKPGA